MNLHGFTLNGVHMSWFKLIVGAVGLAIGLLAVTGLLTVLTLLGGGI